MLKPLNLYGKIAITIIGFSAVVIAILSIISYQSGRKALTNAVVSDLFSSAYEKELALQRWLNHKVSAADAIGNSSDVRDLL